MVFAYALNEINGKWVMKIETNKLMIIRKNVEYFENDVSTKFFQIHTVTGCDTTSFYTFFHWKRKGQTLNTIGVSCKVLGTAVKDVEKFIQTVCYSGKKE